MILQTYISVKRMEMANDKVAETVIVGNYVEMESEGKPPQDIKSKLSSFLWHGGSAYDAWFSCASNQVSFSSIVINVFYIYTLIVFLYSYMVFHIMRLNVLLHYMMICDSGGSSSAYVTILIFPAGNAFWHTFSTLLWYTW